VERTDFYRSRDKRLLENRGAELSAKVCDRRSLIKYGDQALNHHSLKHTVMPLRLIVSQSRIVAESGP